MPKTNRFHVKEIDKQNVTVEEERKYRSPFILFLIFFLLNLNIFFKNLKYSKVSISSTLSFVRKLTTLLSTLGTGLNEYHFHLL